MSFVDHLLEEHGACMNGGWKCMQPWPMGWASRRSAAGSISPRNVDVHRTNLMRKPGIHHLAGLVRVAMKAGLIK